MSNEEPVYAMTEAEFHEYMDEAGADVSDLDPNGMLEAVGCYAGRENVLYGTYNTKTGFATLDLV